jgi:hypothetical protein
MVAQSIRQKQKERPGMKISTENKQQLVNQIKNLSISETQKTLSQKLDLKILQMEKVKIQKDESIRLELTFTKSQIEKLKRAKEVLSHKLPQSNWSELFCELAEEFLKRKDLTRKKPKCDQVKRKSDIALTLPAKYIDLFSTNSATPLTAAETSNLHSSSENFSAKSSSTTSTVEAATGRKPVGEAATERKPIARTYIPIKTKREIFQRDQCCQWRNKSTGKICGSKYLLQLDHIQPRWANGSNDRANLQLLCGIHNRMKYKQEAFLL